MIVGCRTIKCYGWEKHYITKIRELREEQQSYVLKLNIIQSFGTSFFQNTGMVAVVIILIMEWYREKELKNDVVVSMLAMIYLVFFAVNITFYFGLTNIMSFLAILKRIASVFAMEESKITRETRVAAEDVMIEAENCSYAWGFRVSEEQVKNTREKVKTEERNEPIITDVNFKLKQNDLMVVVGMVGSGKTTLLHSIMEETQI